MARLVSTRSTCPRASIGCVLVKHKRVISTGYNGTAEGEPHCPNTAEHLYLAHCKEAIHAEANVLRNALVPVFGATLYLVGPRDICSGCAESLRLAGVSDIRTEEKSIAGYEHG